MSSHGEKIKFFEFVGPQVKKMNSPWNEENNIFLILKKSKMGLVSRLVVCPQDKKVESNEKKKKV